MAQKFCSFCCCSCCTSPSPSTPQSSQRQQQQPISSPPPHQTITAHSSSSPQQSPPTMAEFKRFLREYGDINNIDTLILLLEKLWENATGVKSQGGGSTSVAPSFIKDGQRMLEMIDKRIGKRPLKNFSGDGTIEEIRKVFIELLKGSEKIPMVGVALCMLGSVFERFNNVHENRQECLDVLKRIVELGKQIVKLNEVIPDEKKKLEDGVGYIIEGSIMCISQLGWTIIPSFVTATVNEEKLKAFHLKVDRFYDNIQVATEIDLEKRVIEMGKRVEDIEKKLPEIAKESQKLYGNQWTAGIDEAKERVINFLDLNAQDTKPVVVVVYGIGGIGKTTLADVVYNQLNLQSYKHCTIQMQQGCTANDIESYQKHILSGLFGKNISVTDCRQGRGLLRLSFIENSNQPLFLYIDNALECKDLEQLLPEGLDEFLPPKSKILITTRNVEETKIFSGRNIVRRKYNVDRLPDGKARELLLKKVPEYNVEGNIVKLLKLCGGVPLLLQLAGSQLALAIEEVNTRNIKNIVLEMLNEGEQVKESEHMVGFVYNRLKAPVQQAFLDIASFFSKGHSKYVSSIVGEEEFRALESASFVKASEGGRVIVHDIVRARGKMLSEGNRLTNVNTLLECLNDDKKLKQLRGIYFDEYEGCGQPAIEINRHHLNCMRHSLKVLQYNGSQITFTEKCQEPFEQLRYLHIARFPGISMLRIITDDVGDLTMEFKKLKHLIYYRGPFTKGMNFYELPPRLRFMYLKGCSENRDTYSKVPPKVAQPSSVVELWISDFENIERLPDGVEMLTELENFIISNCHKLKELPSNFGELKNLKDLEVDCYGLQELPSDFGQLQNLESLKLLGCSKLVKLPLKF